MRGYVRAGLALLENLLAKTRGRGFPHSYALARMFDSLQMALLRTYEMDKQEHYSKMPAFGRLNEVVEFTVTAIALVDKNAYSPKRLKIDSTNLVDDDIYDDLARHIFEIIFATSHIGSPTWTSWAIQHNAVWSRLFGVRNDKPTRIIAFKVRRLMYDEIRHMDISPNFKGARILGYCLHVFGLKPQKDRLAWPLQINAVRWVKANYRRLITDHPQVAKACLHGSVTFDSTSECLVQTWENETEREPIRETLRID